MQTACHTYACKNKPCKLQQPTQFLGEPFLKRFALCYQTVICLSCPVTLVYCGQTVRWMKMPLGMEVGLNPGHIVLHEDPDPPPKRGTAPNFWLMSVMDKWMDGYRYHLVRRYASAQATLYQVGDTGDPAPPQKMGHSSPPLFGPCPLWPNS